MVLRATIAGIVASGLTAPFVPIFSSLRRDDPDGCYQVLSVQRPKDTRSPELAETLSKIFQRVEP
mgnify:CR=1 FL=1